MLGDVRKPVKRIEVDLYWSEPLDVIQYLLCCVFTSEMFCSLFHLLCTTETEVSPFSLQAMIKQVWCSDDGHET